MNLPDDAPYHAHIYFPLDQRGSAEELRNRFEVEPGVIFVGPITDGKSGPHPLPQFEVHFRRKFLEHVRELILASGSRALVHPITENDLADHTSLAEWFGEPLELDLTTLDPPGMNKGIARFGSAA